MEANIWVHEIIFKMRPYFYYSNKKHSTSMNGLWQLIVFYVSCYFHENKIAKGEGICALGMMFKL